MYEFIQGRVAEIAPTFAVIETHGIGYYLNISLQTFSAVGTTPQALLYTHFIVREDAQILYGFFTRQERELFRLLIGVSGVGGNTARMILSTYAPDELKTIIATDKPELLKQVKGLGIKTAQKIIVELKDKVLAVGNSDATGLKNTTLSGDSDLLQEALSAMTMLGFARQASEKVLREILQQHPQMQVEDIIRTALKKL